MSWNEAVVTNVGLELLARCVAGGSIEIVSAVGGEKISPSVALMALKDIDEPKHELKTAGVERIKNGVTVNVRVQNNGLTEGYCLRQIGIFARLENSGEAPVLLALIQDQKGEEVPTEEENPEYLLEYDFVIPLSNAENVTVSVTPHTFATLEDISEMSGHIGDSVRHVTSAERTAWNGKAAGSHGHGAATQSADGFMSASDKKKLDGIAAGANAYVHPTTAGNRHIPSGGASGQILRWSADGTAAWGADNNTTYNAATQSANGLMSAADKIKLDGIAAGANAYTHPVTSGNKHIPSGGASGQILRWSADGTAAWGADNTVKGVTVGQAGYS
ncbi:MAG: hypothetical protein NC394_06860, partial [Bacteroides sp.]|nr:hypothetical protein [Bacteroides sp.]